MSTTTTRNTRPILPGYVQRQAEHPMFAIGYAESAARRSADDLASVLAQLDAHADASDNPAEAEGTRHAASTVESAIRMLRLSSQVLNCVKGTPKTAGLIAAAPEMLDALRNIQNQADQNHVGALLDLGLVRAAIAKAEGRTS